MKHFALLIGMSLTCILAAISNVVLSKIIGFDIFTMKVWLLVPVGAFGFGMLGASGALLAARYFNIKPTKFDAALMAIIAAATMVLIYYIDYFTLVLEDGSRVADFLDFPTYLDISLTKAHLRVGRGNVDSGEVGTLGYYLAGIEFLGFLLGGATTFLTITGLWCCSDCGSYLRKLKTKKSAELTIDETANLLDHFEAGDLETVKAVIAWAPPIRALSVNERRALITYDLFNCAQCKSEVISAKVQASQGNEWKEIPSLTRRRDLSVGFSLRDSFAKS